MKRRDLIIGLAAGAAGAADTVYIPPRHRVEDLALLHETMEEYSFVDLITTTPTLRITHIPTWIDRKAGKYGTIYGHVARANEQASAISARANATIVFHGPHSYISPTWYANQKVVPTWNFAAVHASGKLDPITEEAAFYDLLATLIKKNENKYGASTYDFSALPRSYTKSLMENIIGFRLPIESIEGKFKLGQERSEADRASVVKHLKPEPAEFTKKFYDRTIPRP